MTDGTDDLLEQLGNRDITPHEWEIYLIWCDGCNRAAEEQYKREEADGLK